MIAGSSFDLVGCAQRSIERVIEEQGLKVLLLDQRTQDVTSMSYSFIDMLSKDLYLIDKLENQARTKQGYLKALVLVQPTEENVLLLCKELRQPLYGDYYLFFTNIVSDADLKELADADEHEVVKQVHELYLDYFPLHPYAFVSNVPKPLLGEGDLDSATAQAVTKSIAGVLLSIRKRPTVRYQGNSRACKRLAEDLRRLMVQESSLFQFRRSEESVVLFVDRCDDILTALLTQWTYEAMIHEFFGLRNHKVTVTNGGKSEDINLIPIFDEFFATHLHSDWGDICTAVREKVTTYQKKTNMDARDLDSMKKMMDKMPDINKDATAMKKHTAISDAMNKLIKDRDLMEVSLVEQEMSMKSSHREHLEQVHEVLDSPKAARRDMIRVVMIYMLRYEKHKDNQIGALRAKLDQKLSLQPAEDAMLSNVLKYGGDARRASDLFNDRSQTARLRGAVRGIGRACESAYTQHEPMLKRTLHSVAGGKLSYDVFPCVASTPDKDWKPTEIVVYVVGGLTYEETRTVKEVADELKGVKVIVGGTHMIRTEEAMDRLGSM